MTEKSKISYGPVFLFINCTDLEWCDDIYNVSRQNKVTCTNLALKSFKHEPVNPTLHRYSIKRINNTQLLKTLWEKKKLLIMSNFFFSHNLFYSIGKIVSPFVNKFDIIS